MKARGLGANYGPYFQSEREEIYQSYLDKLKAADRVYDDQGSMRFRFAREKIVVDDVVCGRIEFDMTSAETNPDMTIRRPDGSWIFHFVNVVDDTEMKITSCHSRRRSSLKHAEACCSSIGPWA